MDALTDTANDSASTRDQWLSACRQTGRVRAGQKQYEALVGRANGAEVDAAAHPDELAAQAHPQADFLLRERNI